MIDWKKPIEVLLATGYKDAQVLRIYKRWAIVCCKKLVLCKAKKGYMYTFPSPLELIPCDSLFFVDHEGNAVKSKEPILRNKNPVGK